MTSEPSSTAARDTADDPDLTLETELETAREELRVADEELRVQRDQLQELLDHRQAATVQRRRVASLLPVPIVWTDPAGRIDEANPAAATLLHVPQVRLLGKPLTTFVEEPDRTTVRRALSVADVEPARIRVHLAPRGSERLVADLVLASTPTAGRAAQVEWTILVPGADRGTDGGTDPVWLAAAVAEISRLPVGETDLRSLLVGVVRIARTALGGSTALSISLGHPAEPTHVAATSETAAAADGRQLRTGEGPSIDAYDGQETVVVDDLASDARWPRLRAAWQGSSTASALAVPVVAGGRRVGVLGCYSTDPFTEPQGQAAEVLALAAGAALEAVDETARLRELADQLDRALASRAVIDQAKGILMARRGCSADEAFAHLSTLSQERNVKLRDLAGAIVAQAGGTGPPVSRRRS